MSARGRQPVASNCCDGTCQQGRRCPLNAARVAAACPRPPVQQRSKRRSTGPALTIFLLVTWAAAACAGVHLLARCSS